MKQKRETTLILPKNLDEDIKRRLRPEEIVRFLNGLDLSKVQDAEGIRFLLTYPERLYTEWTETEANYLLYGGEQNGSLVCTDSYFEYYNFFHYIDMNNPEEAAREDLCQADRGVASHLHTLAYNPEKNKNLGNNLLGTLHNHPNLGFSFRRRATSVDSVGFSTYDERWNNRYLERYATDGRKLAFVIYYSGPNAGFYVGAFSTRHTQPELLKIVVE